ncbi:MAG: low molecular weight phosphotyrosine protein phosphatase [Methylovulum sp.]|nr:low molecular weight phosphotyrosine protein phosphatase [Methylovulum sp.]
MEKIKVLFVCMGNICRSPTAEGVFTKLIEDRYLLERFAIDSAGTHAYHVGDAPDLRAQKAARNRGVELAKLRARKFTRGDFEDFDFILAMDEDNYSILSNACPDEHKDKVRLFLDYAPHLNVREVPDPYYGGSYGFERVLDLVEAASEGLLKALKESGRL